MAKRGRKPKMFGFMVPNFQLVELPIDYELVERFLELTKAKKTGPMRLYDFIYRNGIVTSDPFKVESYISIKKLAELIEVSKRTIDNYIEKLIQEKLLIIIRTDKGLVLRIILNSRDPLLDEINRNQELINGKSDVINGKSVSKNAVEFSKNAVQDRQNDEVKNDAINDKNIVDYSRLHSYGIDYSQSLGNNNPSRNNNNPLSLYEKSEKKSNKRQDLVLTPEKTGKSTNRGPKLPIYVSEVLDYNLETIGALNVRGSWYWAIQRYKIHKADMFVDDKTFGGMAIKYGRNLNRALGQDWDKHTEYIDWYLNSEDDFIKNQCEFSFDYMATTRSVNKWLTSKGQDKKEDPKLYYMPDDLESIRDLGKWVKD